MIEPLLASLPFEFPLLVLLILIFAGFVAGYIDAVAGGGGMIQTLALLMAGVPPIATLATNKFASLTGTITAVAKYASGRVIPWSVVAVCLIPCVLIAAGASKLVMYFSDSVVTWLIIMCIPVALLFALLPQQEQSSDHKRASRMKAILLVSPIAFYDGLIGPGTGTYLAIAANRGLHMSFLRATAFAKPLNLATNIGSAIIYILAGKVLWIVAVPMALASMLGAYLGSHSAMKYGDAFIKRIMVIMLIIMLLVNIAKLL